MTRYSSLRVVAVAVAGVFAGWPTAAQAPADRSGAAVLATPPSLVTEHRQLRDDVARAAADRGAVGDAARTIEHLLTPHLQHEEEVVLAPIGLVPALAEGVPPADSARALAVVEQVERELPRLLTEHRALMSTTGRLTGGRAAGCGAGDGAGCCAARPTAAHSAIAEPIESLCRPPILIRSSSASREPRRAAPSSHRPRPDAA